MSINNCGVGRKKIICYSYNRNEVNMNEKKSNKKILIIVAVFSILISLVLGFIAGYSCDNDNKKEDSNVEISSEPINSTIINDIKKFPTANDSSVKDYSDIFSLLTEEELKTNFSKIIKEKDGSKYEFFCDNYEEDEGICDSVGTTILGLTIYSNYDLYRTDKYSVVIAYERGGVDNIDVYIYDLAGDLQYKYEDTICGYDSFNEEGVEEYYSVDPKIVNNMLYLIIYDKNNPGKEYAYPLKFSYINLNNSKLKDELIQNFTAYSISYES